MLSLTLSERVESGASRPDDNPEVFKTVRYLVQNQNSMADAKRKRFLGINDVDDEPQLLININI